MAVALIVAAGSGERLGADRAKAFVVLGGKPMLQWSVEALQAVAAVRQIVVALPPGEEAPAGTVGVRGGDSRSASVRAALEAAGEGDPVIVHDAARPLATTELFERALAELEARDCDAVVAATAVVDTIKRASGEGPVEETLRRADLWAAQTPQVFRRAALERAIADEETLAGATDDASLVERHGEVRLVEAPAENVKVTTALDLRLAELVIAERRGSEIVREVLRRFAARDNEGALALLADDVTWDTSGLPDFGAVTGSYRGREGVSRFFVDWFKSFGDMRLESDEIQVGERGVVVRTQSFAVGRRSGVEVDMPPYWLVYTVVGGLIEGCHFYAVREEAMRRAGLA